MDKPPPAARAAPKHSVAERRALHAIALFEALKGAVVLLAASGLLTLIHRDVHAVAARLIEHLHLDPASRYPRIFLDAAANLHDGRLLLLAAGAAVYALLRFVEAYGLHRGRAWAQVLAAVSGGIYVPFELGELLRRPTWHGGALLAINLLVVVVMVHALWQRRGHRGERRAL
jgi:uncharacterized membrane protein (DUF2068 family)